ncbi:MAG: glycosyltransferase family 25 protein [Pseudomonadota bacterium]
MAAPLPCPIYVINLDGSDARLRSAEAQITQAGLRFTRFSAVDGRGKALSAFPEYDPQQTWRKFGRDMTSGEVGCYLSHLSVAQRLLDSDAAAALVLEDDFAAKAGAWDQVALTLKTLQRSCDGWELVNLGRAPTSLRRPITPPLYRAPYFPVTTTALLWSRDGARRFVQQAARPSGPVDHILRRLMCESGQGFALDPAPFETIQADSDISAASDVPPERMGLQARGGHRRRRQAEIWRQGTNFALALRTRLRGPRDMT